MSFLKLKSALFIAGVFAASLFGPAVFAQDVQQDVQENTLEVAEDAESSEPIDMLSEVAQNVQRFLGNFEITGITESPMAGVYELVSGGTIFYVNAEGTLLIEGDMICLLYTSPSPRD